MANIELPDDCRAAVQVLPETQHPFGADCQLPHRLQSVFFHYDVPKDAVKHFIAAVGANMVSIRMANPDSSDGKAFFAEAVRELQPPSAVFKLKRAVRRICLADPFAALSNKRSADPPSSHSGKAAKPSGSGSKSLDGSSRPSSSGASGKDGSAFGKDGSASSAKNSSKSDVGKESLYEDVSESDWSDDDDDDDDDDAKDPGDDGLEGKKSKSTSEVKCLNQLFNKVANDVSYGFLLPVCIVLRLRALGVARCLTSVA